MISKETFVKVIDLIKKQEEIDKKFGESLETVCDSWCFYGLKNSKYDALNMLLKEIFKDEGDFIGWWLYEDVDKVITYTKPIEKEVRLDTAEQLYDFLVEGMGEN